MAQGATEGGVTHSLALQMSYRLSQKACGKAAELLGSGIRLPTFQFRLLHLLQITSSFHASVSSFMKSTPRDYYEKSVLLSMWSI